MEKIKEIKEDIAELESLIANAKRPKVRGILSIECRKLATELIKIEEETKAKQQVDQVDIPLKRSTTQEVKRYKTRLNNYAWDQTNKFLKFYITLKSVQTLPPEQVTCTFTPKSLDLSVNNLGDRDYVFTINNFLRPIIPDQCSWKVKSDMVIVSVAKETPEQWSHVTLIEESASKAKKPAIDKNEDPTSGLMSLMKNMYESGDDEMKRTIAKAWTESQEKRNME